MDSEVKVADVLRQAEAGRGRLTSRTSLARAIAAADVDGDGTLSAQELFAVFASEQDARHNARFWWKLCLLMAIFTLLMLAANAGMTVAVVLMAKDTGVSTNNVMVVKGTDTPRMSFKQGNTTNTFRICGTSVNTEKKMVLIYTCVGQVLVLADDAVPFRMVKTEHVLDNGLTVDSITADMAQAPAAGRRLLYDSPPCTGCRRWSTNLCGLNICVSCTFRMFCTMIILIETIDVSDMISSSALIYRPDILNNPNVSYFY
ncbi:hypothetical protein C2E20_5176 [Micractinium conductrix]|uniref:EF-hand domain-containing protein n=1 Tax=Micractinium conductrix TaxID=554055 RepID=A0A2P6VC01_9CHLO|nr:hypothetical protein C2E20_5176 [Micractinium conductrix]|eukprot:PSC71581.1 hypothetical protein C2E20_5176 [Micractinium conductrix]